MLPFYYDTVDDNIYSPVTFLLPNKTCWLVGGLGSVQIAQGTRRTGRADMIQRTLMVKMIQRIQRTQRT